MLTTRSSGTNHLTPNRLSGLFETFFGDAVASPLTTLPLAAWHDENAVHVEVDLPGVADKDLDISVHGRVLSIRGERKIETREGGFDTRTQGAFEQRLALPTPVDADRVEATYVNGVLKLVLPKSEAAKPKKIEVRG